MERLGNVCGGRQPARSTSRCSPKGWSEGATVSRRSWAIRAPAMAGRHPSGFAGGWRSPRVYVPHCAGSAIISSGPRPSVALRQSSASPRAGVGLLDDGAQPASSQQSHRHRPDRPAPTLARGLGLPAIRSASCGSADVYYFEEFASGPTPGGRALAELTGCLGSWPPPRSRSCPRDGTVRARDRWHPVSDQAEWSAVPSEAPGGPAHRHRLINVSGTSGDLTDYRSVPTAWRSHDFGPCFPRGQLLALPPGSVEIPEAREGP